MSKRGLAIGWSLGAASLIGLLAACGGKVTWVEDGGPSGGAGGSGTSSKSSSKSSGAKMTTGASTVQQGTSVVATNVASSGNVMPGCDNGELGQFEDPLCQDCIQCTLNSTCFGPWQAFNDNPDGQAFLDCIDQCFDPMCEQKCQDDHPVGVALYIDLIQCVICEGCPNNCDAQQNCFGAPPQPGTGGGPKN